MVNVGEIAVKKLDTQNDIKPKTMKLRRPLRSESHPKTGALIAYISENTVTIHPATAGVISYSFEINGNRGDITNKSVPIINKVSHPVRRYMFSFFLRLKCTLITFKKFYFS
jgi:hypothetical protein